MSAGDRQRALPSLLQRARSATPVGPRQVIRTKSGAAGLSIVSNSVLISLKIAAGAITGSIAMITEAVHSSIDLMASVVAFISVRKAAVPADADHPYGHTRVENLAAVIEGMLIVVGAGIIIFEATRRLVDPPAEIDLLGVGIAVAAFSTLANVAVSTFLHRRAREHRSPALEGDAAHLQTDAMTSAGLLVGLGIVQLTGIVAFDSITALLIAVAIVVAGIRILSRSSRVLVDEAPPPEELDLIESVIADVREPEVAGYHKLRARRSGGHRHVDLHVQFRSGTTLERAHELAHELRKAIEDALPYSDVLIHVEPEGSVTPPEEDQPLRHGQL